MRVYRIPHFLHCIVISHFHIFHCDFTCEVKCEIVWAFHGELTNPKAVGVGVATPGRRAHGSHIRSTENCPVSVAYSRY